MTDLKKSMYTASDTLLEVEVAMAKARVINVDLLEDYFGIDTENHPDRLATYFDDAQTKCHILIDYIAKVGQEVKTLRETLDNIDETINKL